MFGQLSRVIYPSGADGGPCPPKICADIIDLRIPSASGCTAGGMPAGDYLFEWSCINCSLISTNSITITDAVTGTVLKTTIPTVDPISGLHETMVTIPYDITPLVLPGEYRFRITAKEPCGTSTADLIIDFCLPIFSEGNMNPALTGAEIPPALFETTRPRYPGIYPNGMAGYKYWALPSAMMETSIAPAIARPTIDYQPNPQFANDFIDPRYTAIDTGSGLTFNPQIAVEAPYATTITIAGTPYPYTVFRSTNIMHGGVKWQVLDWM